MRTLTRQWTRLVAWLSSKGYLVERHAKIKAENASLRDRLEDQLSTSERLVATLAQESQELRDARQQLQITEGKLEVHERVAAVHSQEFTQLQERHNTLIARFVSLRTKWLREHPEDHEDLGL